jgi:hypothetical protein
VCAYHPAPALPVSLTGLAQLATSNPTSGKRTYAIALAYDAKVSCGSHFFGRRFGAQRFKGTHGAIEDGFAFNRGYKISRGDFHNSSRAISHGDLHGNVEKGATHADRLDVSER